MTTSTPSNSNNNTFRIPPRTSSLNPPLSPGITPARQAQLNAAPYSHHNEDPLIFEIGARLLKAGFAGEGAPRCVLEWSSEVFWCREGRVWTGGARGERGELWEDDLRNVEVGVVEDVVERGVRMAYNKYLLLDSKLKRLHLVTPPFLPTPLLTSVLKSLFVHFQIPGIMLLPSATMSTLSAGTRHSLHLSISHTHTSATPIFELRPIGFPLLTRRGNRLLTSTFQALLAPYLPPKYKLHPRDLDDIIVRLAWCRRLGYTSAPADDQLMSIPLGAAGTIKIPFGKLAEPAENTFFAATTVESSSPDYPDDDDLSLPRLVYEALRRSPVDVRAACMSRIIIVGGASNVLGLKKRIVDEVRAIVEREGWGWCRGGRGPPTPPAEPVEETHKEDYGTETGGQEAEVSFSWRQEGGALSPGSPRGGLERREQPPQTPKVRGLESLGAWVGASLVAGMKGRGVVEVEREKFLQAVAGGGSGLPLGY